jgi:quercetin dioxygenase-like cupin family protein
MIIVSPDEQAGPASKAGSQFTGTVHPHLTLPAIDGVLINNVNFTPAARTYWHSHENGQVLQVLAGAGRIQSAGGPVREIWPGDTIWASPGEQHWHGAAPGTYMVHTAISLGETRWADAVTDSEYNG